MKIKTILFLFLIFFLYPKNFNDLSLDEFKHLFENSANKKILLQEYLEFIAEEDGEVNSIISLYDANKLYKDFIYARRSPWQGVPIVIKDNIDSAGLANTAGSLALTDNFPRDDAHIVKLLKRAGFLVVGKANLSEWANFRGNPSTSGWSSYGGQTTNAYNSKYNPCGSSSGSAAAVALGIVPVSIGTETNGSISCPAAINGVVGIKPTVGLVSRDGIIPISETQDTAGPMARNVQDAAQVLHAISGKDFKDIATANIPKNYNYQALIELDSNYLNGKRIGLLRNGEESEIQQKLLSKVEAVLTTKGAIVIDVSFEISSNYKWDNEYYVLLYQFREGLNNYLRTANSRMKNLDQLIEFNEENSKTVLQHFGHEIFLESQQAQDEEKYLQALEIITDRSRNQIDSLLDNKGLDALVGLTRNPAWKTDLKNGDSRGDEEVWATGGLSAVAGYPHITIPLDLVNGFPVGVSFLASAWQEAKLINMAYSFEEQNSFYPRPKNTN